MKVVILNLVLAACVVILGGCATVLGTAVSPVSGGIDLTRYHSDAHGSVLLTPFVFVGGAVAGPFAALWNGVNQDCRSPWPFSWDSEDTLMLFRPFEMVDRQPVFDPSRSEPDPERQGSQEAN